MRRLFREHRWSLIGVYIFILAVVMIGFFRNEQSIRKVDKIAKQSQQQGVVTKKLAKQNENRIQEIQAARIASCKSTYEGVRQVFKPFTQGPQTPAIKKFNNRIDQLKANCPIQTHVKKKPDGGG